MTDEEGSPELFYSHKGVDVYHVHKDGFGAGRKTIYWYSTRKSGRFDVRERLGMDSGAYIKEHDLDWLPRFEADLKKVIASAIDQGRLQ